MCKLSVELLSLHGCSASEALVYNLDAMMLIRSIECSEFRHKEVIYQEKQLTTKSTRTATQFFPQYFLKISGQRVVNVLLSTSYRTYSEEFV